MPFLAICDGARLTEDAASCLLNSAWLEAESRFSLFVTVLSGRRMPFLVIGDNAQLTENAVSRHFRRCSVDGECRFSPFVTVLG